jgi:hypothetical protein
MTTQTAKACCVAVEIALLVARLVSFPTPYDDRFSIGPAVERIASSVMQCCDRWTLACASISTSLKPERTTSCAAAQHKAIRKFAHQGADRSKGRDVLGLDRPWPLINRAS